MTFLRHHTNLARHQPGPHGRRTARVRVGAVLHHKEAKPFQEIAVMKRIMPFGDSYFDDQDDDGPFTNEPEFAGPFSENPIRVVECFSAADLRDVFEGKILAFAQRKYLDPVVCEYAANRVMQNAQMDFYEVEKVRRHFRTFHDISENPALAAGYFDGAQDAMNDLRQIFQPHGCPIDRLHTELDERFPAGAKILAFHHEGRLRKCKRATLREFPEGSKIDFHHDNFSFYAERFPGAPKIRLQISFSVILRLGEKGGETILCTRRIRTREEEAALRDPQSKYGLRQTELGNQYALKPEVGMLFGFLANRAHTVCPTFGGNRVTASLFAGLHSYDEPLQLVN